MVKDILASLFISLCGTVPSTILTMMLVMAKPATIKTTKKHKTQDSEWNTDWVKEAWQGGKKDGTMRVAHFNENLTELIANKGYEDKEYAKVKAVGETRLYLFHKTFPLPH
eukprot:263710_1